MVKYTSRDSYVDVVADGQFGLYATCANPQSAKRIARLLNQDEERKDKFMQIEDRERSPIKVDLEERDIAGKGELYKSPEKVLKDTPELKEAREALRRELDEEIEADRDRLADEVERLQKQINTLRIAAEKAARLLAKIGPAGTDLCDYHQVGFELAKAMRESTATAADWNQLWKDCK